MGSYQTIRYYKFSDVEPIQVDYGEDSFFWQIDYQRRNLDYKDYLMANKYFDTHIHPLVNTTDSLSIQEIFHLYEMKNEAGPHLTFSVNSLKEIQGFTVELWMAFSKFTTGNFSIIGMIDKPWDQGFSIGGVMTDSEAIISCLVNTKLTSTMLPECYTDTDICISIKSLMTWYHLSCSRSSYSGMSPNGKLIINDISMISQKTVNFNDFSSIEELFTPGKVILGRKETGLYGCPGFNGYLRDIRIWSEILRCSS